MRGYSLYLRPAGAAIAAVLAFGSTYSYAQEAPAPTDAVVVPPPVISAPTATASQPMVQPTQSVDERIAAAVAASQAEAAADETAAPVARAERQAAPKRQQPTRRTVADVTPRELVTPVAQSPQPETPAPAPVAAPVAAADPSISAPEAASAPTPAPEPSAIADGMPNESLYWALGGGALLLLGLGGAAAFRRRRVDEDAVLLEEADRVIVDRTPAADPVVRTTPAAAYAAAPQNSLEAMVAAPPSAENPFLTPSKRMRRARFLLAQQERGDASLHTPAAATAPPQTIHAEPQMQTVYRLGKDRGRRKPGKIFP